MRPNLMTFGAGLFKARVVVYAVPGGRPVHDLDLFRKTATPPGVRSLAFSPDGRWLVAGARDGALHAWDLKSEKPIAITRREHSKEVASLAFKPDGRYLVSCAGQKDLKVWDTST